MSDTKIPASEVTPGMRFRSLGSGYISREVTAVHTGCPCRFGVKALNGPDRTHICRQTVMLESKTGWENFRHHCSSPVELVTIAND